METSKNQLEKYKHAGSSFIIKTGFKGLKIPYGNNKNTLMSLISLSNDKLLLEISPEMGASITKFKNLKSGKDIFRPFPNKKENY